MNPNPRNELFVRVSVGYNNYIVAIISLNS
jgi:hypothetical protein